MRAQDLKKYVIEPTLKKIDLYSDSAVQLLVGTAAQESHLGEYLHQVNGPALGIYQIEPNTHVDIWENFLEYHGMHAVKVSQYLIPDLSGDDNLLMNLAYQTIIARLIYKRAPAALPSADDVEGLATYWKRYYNTEKGKGKVEDFIHNFKTRVVGA